jgi:hypothetical protein
MPPSLAQLALPARAWCALSQGHFVALDSERRSRRPLKEVRYTGHPIAVDMRGFEGIGYEGATRELAQLEAPR